MKTRLSELLLAAACAVAVSGCNSSGDTADDTSRPNNRPASSDLSVFGDFIAPQQLTPEIGSALGTNLLSDSGFESDQWGWIGCAADSISVSDDAHEGQQAMAVKGGSCAYRSVQVSPGESYTFSCYTRLASPTSWTGLGMTYATDRFQELLVAPTAVITAADYVRVDTTAVAPEGSAFLSLWLYSDPGVIVDSCSLSLSENAEVPQEQIEVSNLLINSDFSQIDAGNNADNWVVGCGGSSVAGGSGLYLADNACVDQAFSTAAVQAINDSEQVTFSCFVADVGGYSDMSIFLGEYQLAGERQITAEDSNTRVSLTVDSVDTATAFVSLYSEGFLSVQDCSVALTGSSSLGGGEQVQSNIVDTALQNGNFTTLVAALQATGLDAVLADSSRQFTVFAPTDAAFDALGADTIAALLADPDTLSDILLYHVLADANVDSATAISLAGGSVTAANGDDLNLSVDNGNLFINASLVTTADVAASNGTIHVIDSVLIPPADGQPAASDIVQTAIDAGFNSLAAALTATGLDIVLADESREFTVFAPTDEAFAALGQDTLDALFADPDTLSDILLYHVLADSNVDSATAISLAGGSVTAANGDDLNLSVDNGNLFINASQVTTADVAASNGTIHVIDSVLIPPADGQPAASNIVQTAIDAGFNSLAAALTATGLDVVLADESREFTVFAPTDAAFAALGQDTLNALFADPDTLSDILLYHVLADVNVDSATAISLAGGSVTAANGDNLNLSVDNGNLFINSSQVTTADVAASNGTIHVIDAVLIPPSGDS